MDEAALARVEEQHTELEGQIAQLRKSLRHWQTLEIDYEGLKEEFSLLPEDCSTQEALDAAKGFAAELVNEQEIRALFGIDKDVRRRPTQAIDLLSKRVDYVSKNALTIKKQLSEAEKKRNALLLAKEPDYRDEAGLPLTEITEELDDNGNVVSSKLETVKSATPQLMEVLKKAGVEDLIENDGVVTTCSNRGQEPASKNSLQSTSVEQNNDSSQSRKLEVETTLLDHPKQEQKSSPNSNVLSPTISVDDSQIVKRSLRGSFPANLDNDSTLDSTESPTNPDDTEEDAALRQEMLEYAHSEIGPIVAQLELEDGVSDISYDENEDQFSLDSDLDDDDIDEEEESEDEYGQTKNPLISGRYRRKMEELEKKLGLKGLQNLGPEPSLSEDVNKDLNKPTAAEAARKAAIKRAESAVKGSDKNMSPDTMKNQPSKKSKKVSFASNLDIAPETGLHSQIKTNKDKVVPTTSLPPVIRSIVERTPTTAGINSSASSISQPRKPSRFRAARDATPQTPLFPPPQTDLPPVSATKPDPAPPANEIMSAAIKERIEPSGPRKAPPPDPYDFDEALHKQEIAGEYYKSRNRMIQKQGGFVRDGEDDNYGEFTAPIPVVDEETGKVKKISRFKAARLR